MRATRGKVLGRAHKLDQAREPRDFSTKMRKEKRPQEDPRKVSITSHPTQHQQGGHQPRQPQPDPRHHRTGKKRATTNLLPSSRAVRLARDGGKGRQPISTGDAAPATAAATRDKWRGEQKETWPSAKGMFLKWPLGTFVAQPMARGRNQPKAIPTAQASRRTCYHPKVG